MIQTLFLSVSAVLNFLVISPRLALTYLDDGYHNINPVVPISSAILNTNRISTKVPVILSTILREFYLNYSNKIKQRGN
jgi:hypothetical protein